ncbi:nucleotide exchange factor GrpE [Conexibacter sp. W3-3-2]|uniref:nucleotide exchange factor GrpE n=1 Tax=Conexibacter sp. W3-3-2 TaxID=2675227 RepID=UPI0012B7F753|nr:nucleotide exchange factor GrpE [Conexibacter sp. W3-3-2]MTD45253.1 nucleotide exchange factor GrpE [Conexibacter sp. W3-3-2]
MTAPEEPTTPDTPTPKASGAGPAPDGAAQPAATADVPGTGSAPQPEPAVDSAAPGEPVAAEAEAAAPEAAPEPDYKDQYLRAVAETDNVRKRARRDVEVAHGRGVAKLAKELLPALDNLERALAAAEAQEGDEHQLTSGIRLVQQELIAALGRVGIVQDAPKGAAFDPHRHEAIAQMPAEGVASGTITEVYSAGYLLGDDVLRAAKVVVAQ